MRILVTGASGFIGVPILDELIKSNHLVMALSRYERKSSFSNLIWLNCNLDCIDEYKNEIIKFDPEILIHLAWSDIPEFTSKNSHANLKKSINFFEFMFTIKNLQKVIVSGSCFEIKNKFGPCIEDCETDTSTYFSWAKVSLLEWLKIKALKNNISLVWMRIFYAYGLGQKPNSLIPSIINSFLSGSKPNLMRPYNCIDLIHKDDIAKAFIAASEKSVPSGIYNVGSGKTKCVSEIVEIIERFFNQGRLVTEPILPSNNLGDEVLNFHADIRKIQFYLDWQPKISIESGLINLCKLM